MWDLDCHLEQLSANNYGYTWLGVGIWPQWGERTIYATILLPTMMLPMEQRSTRFCWLFAEHQHTKWFTAWYRQKKSGFNAIWRVGLDRQKSLASKAVSDNAEIQVEHTWGPLAKWWNRHSVTLNKNFAASVSSWVQLGHTYGFLQWTRRLLGGLLRCRLWCTSWVCCCVDCKCWLRREFIRKLAPANHIQPLLL